MGDGNCSDYRWNHSMLSVSERLNRLENMVSCLTSERGIMREQIVKLKIRIIDLEAATRRGEHSQGVLSPPSSSVGLEK